MRTVNVTVVVFAISCICALLRKNWFRLSAQDKDWRGDFTLPRQTVEAVDGNRAEGRAAVAGVPAHPEEAEVTGKIVGQESRSFYSKDLCFPPHALTLLS
jgi:hypothetical protein